MTITSLRAVGTAGERVSITLDRKAAGQIDALLVIDFDLARGDTLTDEQIDPLIAAIDRCGCLKRALRLLNSRDRATGELRTRLRRAGHATPAIEATLERLDQAGLLNDDALAHRLAENLADRGKSGRRLIELKLAQRGIDRSLASRAAAEAASERDALADAIALVSKRVQRASPDLDHQTLTRRLTGFLARRGFEHDVLREAVRTALADRPPPPSPDELN